MATYRVEQGGKAHASPRTSSFPSPQAERGQSGEARGVTLIELIFAIFISGIVITGALYSWSVLAGHTTMQKRKSLFYSQAEAISSLIANDIRTSPDILEIHEKSISMLGRFSADTLTYSFDGDSLRKNKTAIPLLATHARIVNFSLEKKSTQTGLEPKPRLPGEKRADIVLVVTIEMQDNTGLKSVIPAQVKIREPENSDDQGGRQWNF